MSVVTWQPFAVSPGSSSSSSGGAPPFYARPANAHPEDEEFEGTFADLIAAGWILAKVNAGVWTNIASAGDVDLRSWPAAGTCRVSVNKRRSWLQMQPCDNSAGDTFVFYKPCTFNFGETVTLRTRMSAMSEVGTDPSKAAFWSFYICVSDGTGRPDLTVTNGATYRPARAPASNSLGWWVVMRNGGSDLVNQMGSEKFGRFEDCEFVYSNPVVAAYSPASLYLRNDGDQLFLGSGADRVTDSAFGNFGFVVFRCHGGIGGAATPKILAADYVRRESTFYAG